MTATDTSATTSPQTSVTPRLGRRATVRLILGNKTDRNMAFAGVSIPGHLAMAISKGALLFIAPSLMLLSNAVFTVGVAAAKFLAVRSHRTARTGMAGLSESEVRAFQLRSYRMIATLILALSLAYVLSSVPLVLGLTKSDRYDYAVALGIALLTFVELTMAICGAIVARRNRELLVEAVRLTSMAGSLILLVLTQTAIMSFAYKGDASVYNGLSGIILGSCAALIGVYMLVRAWWLARRSAGSSAWQPARRSQPPVSG